MPVSVMSPSSQHHLAVAGCDGRGGEGDLVTLKICECYFGSVFSEDDQTIKVDTEASFERESDPSSEEEILQKDDIEDVEDRLSLVNETGSLSGEEDGGLIDEDDSIYKVQFPNSFAELEESQVSVSKTPPRQSRSRHRRHQTVVNFDSIIGTSQKEVADCPDDKREQVEAWLNSETSLKKQRKGILVRKSQLGEDILQPRSSPAVCEDSFIRKIHPKYCQASLNVVKDFSSEGASVGKRKRVSLLAEEDTEDTVENKRARATPPSGWLSFLPGWVSGLFK